jgi:hypothetical protein
MKTVGSKIKKPKKKKNHGMSMGRFLYERAYMRMHRKKRERNRSSNARGESKL